MMNIDKMEVLLGYAEVDITPTESVELVGFDRVDNRSKGVLHRLVAEIALWEATKERFCLLTVDNLGFTVEITNSLRDRIAQRLGVARERVMVCFSHTHAGPNVAHERAYLDRLFEQILGGIDEAMGTLAPVKAAWGVTDAEIGINRRDQNGRLDRRVGVLQMVDSATGRPRLLMLRVTAHANVLTGDNYLISSDFFGVTRSLLKKSYGCPVMITQGAAGNVRPKYQQTDAEYLEVHAREASMETVSPDTATRRFSESMEALDKMAAQIRDAVDTVIKDLKPQTIDRIDMFSQNAVFTSEVPAITRARKIADEAKREAAIDGSRWLAEVERLHQEGVRQQEADVEIQYFVVNNGCWCGTANEAMCEIALDISEEVDHGLIFFGGYTNGCNSYLPTAEEFRKGGFEVLWAFLLYYQYHGRVMPLREDTADRLVEMIARKWNTDHLGFANF